jgi:hypothetical protein
MFPIFAKGLFEIGFFMFNKKAGLLNPGFFILYP